MGRIIRFPFVDASGKIDFPGVLGFVVAVVAAVYIARKLPIVKELV